ncbi:MAG: DeoR/GlpR family DNA-binding transcription regulator [Eubacteriales bacterium]|nr:DeoR/GlpR family DNA-binding transcription regulator [Eubacteriales bacterium]
MLKEFRLNEIKSILKRDGEVQNNTLCKMFNVSEMTIRRDLDVLSNADTSIVRTHGGAYLVSTKEMREPPYTLRVQKCCEEKEKIAKKALELIEPGQNIFLDSGTTTYYIARNIPMDYRNMILTNGLNIAQEAINHRNLSVFLIGGDLRQNSLSTCGSIAEEILAKFRIDITFLGANAIDEEGNAYVGTTSEVGLKNRVIQQSVKSYILADSSKFSTHNLVSYTNAVNVAGIITDAGISEEIVQKLESANIQVIIAA